LPKFGWKIVRTSLLPELRGGALIHSAITDGNIATGSTIMYMEEKLYSGDSMSWAKSAIEISDHVGTLHDKLAKLGADLLLKTLPSIFAGTNERIKQDETKATYAPNITREQEKIDWTKSSEEVYNHIRGLHPWPVAYTTYKGERWKIWWGEMDDATFDGEPGEIAAIDDASITVVCGDKKGIRLVEIQPSGKKRMSVSEFLRGNKDLV